MRFMKILILILSVIFVTNCSDSTASDPQTDFFIEKFVEDGNSEKDAKCLAFAMKKSMPEDLWNNYYDLIVMQESEEDMDMEELGALMEFAFAALPSQTIIVPGVKKCSNFKTSHIIGIIEK